MYKHARAPRLLIHERSDNQVAALRDAMLEVRGLARATPWLSGQSALDLLQERLIRRGISTAIAHWVRDELLRTGCLQVLASSQADVSGPARRGEARARRRFHRFGSGNWRPIEKALTALLAPTGDSLRTRTRGGSNNRVLTAPQLGLPSRARRSEGH